MMFPKKAQTAYRGNKHKKLRKTAAYMPESIIQNQMDDMLDAMQIEHRRIPDQIWKWLVLNAPPWITKELSLRWKSKPDTLALIPITEKYSLACEVELKTEIGVQSKRQKDYSSRMPVQISRSPDDNIKIIMAFAEDAKIIKKILAQNMSR